MNYKKYIKFVLLFTLTCGVLTTSSIYDVNAETTAVQQPVSSQVQTSQGIYVKPLTVVNSPKTYLNKSIIMSAKFDKFSTLGLDYKPALKSSENYISFLILLIYYLFTRLLNYITIFKIYLFHIC